LKNKNVQLLSWLIDEGMCVQCCGRPDLVDYRQARRRPARQNLDMAFNIFEREFGVTRLLDPEGRLLCVMV